VPQGSIVSPILSNLYLDKFDKFMEKYIERLVESNKGERSFLPNPEYVKVDTQIQNIMKSVKTSRPQRYKKTVKKAELLKRRRELRSTIPNPKFTKI